LGLACSEEEIMEAVSIRVLAGLALDALRDVGASVKTLKECRCTGFGELCRRFEARGQVEYSASLAEVIVHEVRGEFESGRVSSWKCGLVRRGAAMLDLFSRTGEVGLPALPPWNADRLPPTREQLSEEGNLHVLICEVQRQLRAGGLSEKTLRNYDYDGFDPIRRAHRASGLTRYSPEVAVELVDHSRRLFEGGRMSPSVWRGLRVCAARLAEVAMTGRVGTDRLARWGLREPSAGFVAALGGFCAAAAEAGWSGATITSARSAVRQLLFAFEDMGATSTSGLTPPLVSDAVTVVAGRFAGGLGHWLFAVRAFLRHLHAAGTTTADLSLAVPGFAAPRRPVREGFTVEDVRALLATSDGDSAVDRRDRAIMTLAANTGLRAGDLSRLRRGDIDWRAGEIRIVQAKTGRALCLPLDVASGNAIAAYLLSHRVPGDSESLFTCCTGRVRPLAPKAMSGVVSRRMRQAGLDGMVPRRGAHSFRRGLGARLLDADTPIDTVRQVLGHTRIDSARPYLSVGGRGLKDCAISLAAVMGEGEL
jgi:integrase